LELKSGYKQTEIGLIPEDWDVVQISAISSVKTGPFGSSLHERDYVRDGTPIITVEHLGEFGIIYSNLPMVSAYDLQRLKSYSLEENDIVFSRVGSVDRNALVRNKEKGWLFSGRLLRVRPNNKRVHSPYLSYHFHHEPFKQRVRNVAVGQTMPSLNTQILNGINIALPPISEQRLIATMLGDVDALITSLEKLIAKKRLIKQGALEQLVTGKTRLPGFSG
jgi:type I restriction enzyme S subunit